MPNPGFGPQTAKKINVSVIFADDDKESQAFNMTDFNLLGVATPGTLEASTTTIKFKNSSEQNGTFLTVNDSTGSAVTMTISASGSEYVVATGTVAAALAACEWLKLILPVSQTSNRIFGVTRGQ